MELIMVLNIILQGYARFTGEYYGKPYAQTTSWCKIVKGTRGLVYLSGCEPLYTYRSLEVILTSFHICLFFLTTKSLNFMMIYSLLSPNLNYNKNPSHQFV
jgi:hypothetical protein